MRSRKPSPETAQLVGPQVEEKKKKKLMQTKTIMTMWETFEAVVEPTMATINSQMHLPTPPQMKRGRRPNFSIAQKPTGVETTLTISSELQS